MLVPLEPPRRDVLFGHDVRFDITPSDGKAWNARIVKLKNDLAKCVQIIDRTRAAFEKCEDFANSISEKIGYKVDGQTAWLQFKKEAQGKPLPKADPFLIEVSTEAAKVANLMYKARNGSFPIHGIDSGRTWADMNPKLYHYLQLASEELKKAYHASTAGWESVFDGVRRGYQPSGRLYEYASVLKPILNQFH